MTASARQRSALSSRQHRICQSELPIPDLAIQRSRDHELASLRWPAVLPAACSVEQPQQAGEEAAMPGQPVALARVCLICPPAIYPRENRRLPLALPQSFGKLRKLHVSLHPLSATSLRLATQKTPALVQKLWTLPLPCGRPRKTKNEHFTAHPARTSFQ